MRSLIWSMGLTESSASPRCRAFCSDRHHLCSKPPRAQCRKLPWCVFINTGGFGHLCSTKLLRYRSQFDERSRHIVHAPPGVRQRDRNPLRAANFIQVEWVRRCSACSKKSLPRCIDERAASNEERAGKARFFLCGPQRSFVIFFLGGEYSLLATRPLALFHYLRLCITSKH